MKKADKNPNAGKTVLILSSAEDAFPDEADINAVTVFNRQNDSYFIKFVFPYDANGNFTEVQLVEGVSTSYAEFTVPLTSYAGNGRNIAIKCGSSDSYLYYYIEQFLYY